jgi:hypothetical protein
MPVLISMKPEKMKIPEMAVNPRVDRTEWERSPKTTASRAVAVVVTRRGWPRIEVFIIVPFGYITTVRDR